MEAQRLAGNQLTGRPHFPRASLPLGEEHEPGFHSGGEGPPRLCLLGTHIHRQALGAAWLVSVDLAHSLSPFQSSHYV